jgi:predicted outer membrane lipoprotein
VLYFALRLTFGRLPALIAGIFIAGSTFMYANGGADYHNTLAGVFYCLSMLFCAHYAQRQFSSRHLTVMGTAIALTVHTNVVFLNLAPILLAQYLLAYRINQAKFPPLIPVVLSIVSGALGITILLGLMNFIVGRQFLFFVQQFRIVSYFLADSSRQQVWWQPWSSFWFLNYPYMGLFFAGTLLSAATLAIAVPRRSRSPRYASASLISVAYLCAAFIWAFWQSVGQTALEPLYFAFPLGLLLAAALAAMVAIMVEREMEPLALTLFAVCFAVMTIIGVHEADAVDKAIGGLSWPLAIRVTIAFSTALACLGLLRWSLWFWPIAGLALAAANALAVSDKAAFAASSCTLNRDAYELVLDAGSALRKIRVPRTKIFLFSDYGEELVLGEGCEQRHALLSGVNDAIVAYGEFQYAAPAWSQKTLETLEPERWREMVTTHGAIAFLTYNPARISVLRDKVQAAGGTPGEASAFRFRAGDMELPLYVLPFD